MTRLLLALALALSASPPVAAQIPPGVQVGLVPYLQAGFDGLRSSVVSAASKMPEDDFSFRPSTMPEVRTFAQVLAHLAESQFRTCASLRAEPNPMVGRSLEKELTTKAATLHALEQSFDFCDVALGRLSESTAADLVKVGRGEAARAAVITGLLAHGSEMYGISTVYLRAKNIAPQ
jgi:DinB superfamily